MEFRKKFCVSSKTWFVPIDHHAIFKMFKLSFCGSDKKCQTIIFLNPFLGHFQKYLTGSESICRSIMASSFQRWSYKSSSFKKVLFCIKDNKNLYIQNVGHIWAYIHANSQDFWKSFNGSNKTKRVKKCGLKMPKNNFLKPLFGALQKIGDWIWKYEQIRHGF